MTTEDTAQKTSPEERFLGVRTTIKSGSKDSPEQIPLPNVVSGDDGESVQDSNTDEELESYSEKVQKRIKHMTWEREEQRRRADAAEKMREEAVRFAKSALQKNQQYETLINQGEGYLLQNQKQAAEMAVAAAKSKYRQAYEEGDTDAILKAQDEMLMEQAKWYEAHKAEQAYHQRSQQAHQQAQQWQAWQQMQRQQMQARPQQQVQVPKPTKKAQDWAEKNPWFGQADHKDMTALAYGIHERLIREEGYDPDSTEYFRQIDREMRKRFPDYFDRQDQARTSSPGRNATVVAPAGRNNGSKPHQVKLTRTQLSLAKRLGITPEQYARQLIKESQHGR